jgi:hypothetical protein
MCQPDLAQAMFAGCFRGCQHHWDARTQFIDVAPCRRAVRAQAPGTWVTQAGERVPSLSIAEWVSSHESGPILVVGGD